MDTIQSMIRNTEGIVQEGFQRRFVSEEMKVKRQEHRRKIRGRSFLIRRNEEIRALPTIRGTLGDRCIYKSTSAAMLRKPWRVCLIEADFSAQGKKGALLFGRSSTRVVVLLF